jgi:hypothetical protein
MNIELSQQIESLKNNEQIDVTVSRRRRTKSPPYTTIGNGISTREFKPELVVDALKVFGDLTPAQQTIVLHFRDAINNANMQAKQHKRPVDHPNEVMLSRIDQQDQMIKNMLRDNGNASKLIDKGVIRKVAMNHYMVNPYMFIPHDNFDKVADKWQSLETKSNLTETMTPQLDE